MGGAVRIRPWLPRANKAGRAARVSYAECRSTEYRAPRPPQATDHLRSRAPSRQQGDDTCSRAARESCTLARCPHSARYNGPNAVLDLNSTLHKRIWPRPIRISTSRSPKRSPSVHATIDRQLERLEGRVQEKFLWTGGPREARRMVVGRSGPVGPLNAAFSGDGKPSGIGMKPRAVAVTSKLALSSSSVKGL